ncbi:hypothetical protein MJG53_006049, partial [Ovis ammon polii x Ovis aries]
HFRNFLQMCFVSLRYKCLTKFGNTQKVFKRNLRVVWKLTRRVNAEDKRYHVRNGDMSDEKLKNSVNKKVYQKWDALQLVHKSIFPPIASFFRPCFLDENVSGDVGLESGATSCSSKNLKLDISLKKKLRKTVTSLNINSEYAELMKHPEEEQQQESHTVVINGKCYILSRPCSQYSVLETYEKGTQILKNRVPEYQIPILD